MEILEPNLTPEQLAEQLLALRSIKAAQEKLLELRANNGLAFYSPHHKQDLFHRAGDFDLRYARTGNRFGKSQMGAAEDCAFALGERPWYDSRDADRTKGIPKHPTKGLIITVDWDKSREIFTEHEGGELGKLFQFLPAGSVKKVFKNSARAVERIIIGRKQGEGESTICIDTVASYKQNTLSGESSVWDWIHIDEPIPQGQWIGASRGFMDRGGKAWFTCTPLTEPWINDMFLPNLRDEIPETLIQELEFEGEKIRTWMMIGSSDDNPHNSARARAQFFLSLRDNPDEAECRRHGTPLSMSGVVYKEFQPAEHVYRKIPAGWSAMDIPPKDYTIRLAIDPHPQIPMAVLFLATSPQGVTYAFHEIFKRVLVKDLCDEILARTKGYHVQDSIIDPLAKTRDPRDNSCMMDEFFANGVWVVEATKAKMEGILKVREFLGKRDLQKRPIIFFGSHLKTTLHEFDRYIYDPKTNEPIDKFDHMMENLYRLALTELEYISPDSGYITRAPQSFSEQTLENVLRNDLQSEGDFEEADLEEEGIVVTKPERRAQLKSWATSRTQTKKRYNDAY